MKHHSKQTHHSCIYFSFIVRCTSTLKVCNQTVCHVTQNTPVCLIPATSLGGVQKSH